MIAAHPWPTLLPDVLQHVYDYHMPSPAAWQADGTLEALLSSTKWLCAMLDVLCGAHQVRREADDGIREALAEAALMLVRC